MAVTAGPAKISVIIATRNRAELLPPLIAAVLDQQVDVPFELIVVDDKSSDATKETLASLAADLDQLRPMTMPRHVGPGAARNAGWQAAVGRLIVFTDDDCMPKPGWLAALWRERQSGIQLIQGRTVADPVAKAAMKAFGHHIQIEKFSNRYETCNIAYDRALLEELGGFDAGFGTSRGGAPWGEDADLGWRAAERNTSTCFAPDAVVEHRVTNPPYRKYLRARLRRYRLVYFVSRHPGYRANLAYGYLVKRGHVVAGCVALSPIPYLIWPTPALLSLIPLGAALYAVHWLRYERLPGWRQRWPILIPAAFLADALECAVFAAGSVRWRTLVL
ncbi:MAG TPA: glycosyltransferase family A protein [Mycobacteriales bacterium]|nr:glycosyltransferase family A protein [Mycobacteriales bacterium]